MSAASVRGTQPPFGTFVALPSTNAMSTVRKMPKISPIRQCGQRHAVPATTEPSRLVITMVPMTDAPYAADSAVEEPNARTKPITATNMIQFAAGT